MKIGVFTLPMTSNNYGGILQAYALTTYLSTGTHTAVLMDRRFKTPIKYRLIVILQQILYPKYLKTLQNFNAVFPEFVNANIKKTPPLLNYSDSQKYISDHNFDVLITGSDQVFRTLYSKDIYRDLFLNFDFQGIKLSYAASYGVDKWEDEEKSDEVKGYLKDFKEVSVREESGLAVCKNKFGIDALCHIDPTMLLEKESYISLFKAQDNLKPLPADKYIGVYILDTNSEKDNLIREVSKKLGMAPLQFGLKPKINRKTFKNYLNAKADSVYDWLNSISNAEYILTDSFHGVAFSIIFKKQFVAIGNQKRGLSRFVSILKMFGLENRLILTENFSVDNLENIFKNKIDYNAVDAILKEEQKKSSLYFSEYIC